MQIHDRLLCCHLDFGSCPALSCRLEKVEQVSRPNSSSVGHAVAVQVLRRVRLQPTQ